MPAPKIPKPPPTHCKWGHEWTPENSYFQGNFRRCKICTLAAQKIRRTVPDRKFPSETECTNGHPWTPESTGFRSNGRKLCRICKNEQNEAYRIRKDLLQNPNKVKRKSPTPRTGEKAPPKPKPPKSTLPPGWFKDTLQKKGKSANPGAFLGSVAFLKDTLIEPGLVIMCREVLEFYGAVDLLDMVLDLEDEAA